MARRRRPNDQRPATERFTDRLVATEVEPNQVLSSSITVLRESAEYQEGFRARLNDQPRHIAQHRQWLYGWDDADEKERAK